MNTTHPEARNVHGTNPQYLVETILRMKIYDDRYWKEHCAGLNSEELVDKAVALKCVGGTYGGTRKPTAFMCLILKMLQIQPEKDIIVEFISQEDYKYIRILGAFYLRLVGTAVDVYQYLEPLLNDYRKVRTRNSDGMYVVVHVDEIIDKLLLEDYYFDISLPRILKRKILEDQGVLEPRRSPLEDLDNLDIQLDDSEEETKPLAIEDRKPRTRSRERRRSRDRRRRSRSRERRRSRSKGRRRSRSRVKSDRKRSRSRDRRRSKSRDRRSRSRDRRYKRVKEEPKDRK